MSSAPSSLKRTISPPSQRQSRKKACSDSADASGDKPDLTDASHVRHDKPNLAAVEAGLVKIDNHLSYFTLEFQRRQRPIIKSRPRISISDFAALYTRNSHPKGCHFVIHQHDHPIAGVHYDLRLQFSATSTISFSIPYGLPGNPDSKRLHRLAVETRVHTLWNNLVESASHETGALIIWDTGEYEVLPRRTLDVEDCTDDEGVRSEEDNELCDSEKLFHAFQKRYVKLRLHGTRLPANYTISLHLPKQNDRKRAAPRKRRKRHRSEHKDTVNETSSDSENSSDRNPKPDPKSSRKVNSHAEEGRKVESKADSDDEDEDATIRELNAYPGATNTIGSIHQRQWIITLDRAACGLVKWRDEDGCFRWVPRESSVADSRREIIEDETSGRDESTESKPDPTMLQETSQNRDGGKKYSMDETIGNDSRTDAIGPNFPNKNGSGGQRVFTPFIVMGKDVETSVVTGRLASDVYTDEGILGYAGRKMWVPLID